MEPGVECSQSGVVECEDEREAAGFAENRFHIKINLIELLSPIAAFCYFVFAVACRLSDLASSR